MQRLVLLMGEKVNFNEINRLKGLFFQPVFQGSSKFCLCPVQLGITPQAGIILELGICSVGHAEVIVKRILPAGLL